MKIFPRKSTKPMPFTSETNDCIEAANRDEVSEMGFHLHCHPESSTEMVVMFSQLVEVSEPVRIQFAQ